MNEKSFTITVPKCEEPFCVRDIPRNLEEDVVLNCQLRGQQVHAWVDEGTPIKPARMRPFVARLLFDRVKDCWYFNRRLSAFAHSDESSVRIVECGIEAGFGHLVRDQLNAMQKRGELD